MSVVQPLVVCLPLLIRLLVKPACLSSLPSGTAKVPYGCPVAFVMDDGASELSTDLRTKCGTGFCYSRAAVDSLVAQQ